MGRLQNILFKKSKRIIEKNNNHMFPYWPNQLKKIKNKRHCWLLAKAAGKSTQMNPLKGCLK
jgi:hypothetical protein